MRKVYEYSHLGGLEILRVRYPAIEREIDEVIAAVKAPKTKISMEKGRADSLLCVQNGLPETRIQGASPLP